MAPLPTELRGLLCAIHLYRPTLGMLVTVQTSVFIFNPLGMEIKTKQMSYRVTSQVYGPDL